MFDANDYNGCDPAREDRLEREREYDERAVRLEMHAAGLCSLRAALEGGFEYEREMADAALELAEAGIARPVAAALGGWMAAVGFTSERRAA